ncbi:MAG: hypothetical protein ACI9GW_002526 [Halieaceae bacterium]|jgi:hypothetical protein
MKNYLYMTLALVVSILFGVGLFNSWADPYTIYQFEPKEPDRISKTGQVFFMRLSKPWQIAQAKPAVLVIGSSRTAPLRPRHASWMGASAYNSSMPALSLYEMQRFIQHAHAQGGLEKLVIGVELATFVADWSGGALGFAEGRLWGNTREKSSTHLLQFFRDIRDTLFSSAAILHSIESLTQKPISSHRFYADGSWENVSPVWLGQPGYSFVGRSLADRNGKTSKRMTENLDILGEILAYCHEQKIDTRLYINPEHVFLIDLREQVGAGQLWTQFHRQLVDLNSSVAERSNADPFPLWGFNNLAGVVDEPLGYGKGSLDDWFRDGVHFHSTLGAIIMDQLWGENKRVGRRLSPLSVDVYLAAVEGLRARFVVEYPEIVSAYRDKILDGES